MFTNPLDDLKIASPCRADWNEMFGDERRRFCGDCKLNVYNLSGMSRGEAESLLMNSEGRLCVRFYRRKDGTVLTRDCPVGWKALKLRVRRSATALASILVGFVAGLFGLRATEWSISMLPIGDVASVEVEEERQDALTGITDEYEYDVVGQVLISSEEDDHIGVDGDREPEDANLKTLPRRQR